MSADGDCDKDWQKLPVDDKELLLTAEYAALLYSKDQQFETADMVKQIIEGYKKVRNKYQSYC